MVEWIGTIRQYILMLFIYEQLFSESIKQHIFLVYYVVKASDIQIFYLEIIITFFFLNGIVALQCCQFLQYNEVNHLYVYIQPLSPRPPYHPAPQSHPSMSPQSTELSPLHYTAGSHQLSVLHMIVNICQSQSQFITSHSPRPVSICPFSTSMYLFLPCKQIYLYHFSRFYTYALIYLFFSF